MRQRLSLLIAVAFLLAGSVAYYGCGVTGESSENQSFNGDLSDPKLQDRLGQDDGYAFAIMYGADTHGSLETCG